MRALIKQLNAAGSEEKKMYGCVASLLTSISTVLYGLCVLFIHLSSSDTVADTLTTDMKEKLRQRYRVPAGLPGHITFVNHSSRAPTHFPADVPRRVKDAPDILGIYGVDDFRDSIGQDGVYTKVPHHRVEAIVEAKPERKGGGRRQATTYAYRHHQARPDHPAVYCLVVKPKWYQVLLSDPTGVVASVQTDWSDLRLLAAYIFSHYSPPRDHFLWDETIAWVPGSTSEDPPTWKVMFQGQWYYQGRLLFIGEPWGRRTTVLRVTDHAGGEIVIKETYLHHKRRFKEEEILAHIHDDGDILGVVRLKGAEHVTTGNKTLKCAAKGEKTLRTKERFALLDSGCRLLTAKTVNDLLEAVYDALEGIHGFHMERRPL